RRTKSMAYNAVEMKDWQISEAAEVNMKTPQQWCDELGLQKDEILPMGRLAKLDFLKIINRLQNRPDGKYIEVTAITPTPLGEGKSTTSVGLMEGLGKRGKNLGRPDHERQGNGGRRRKRSDHSHDRVFTWPHWRYQRHHERPQLGNGRLDSKNAA
ncbi:MAG: formate--tetrahydrofolate ligase, partial [Burkholderiaceae bacterium]|nr:formate--tetrahydrofolate ligase [Burkholderiaceae bacterium]